jgi:hypothetical protein
VTGFHVACVHSIALVAPASNGSLNRSGWSDRRMVVRPSDARERCLLRCPSLRRRQVGFEIPRNNGPRPIREHSLSRRALPLGRSLSSARWGTADAPSSLRGGRVRVEIAGLTARPSQGDRRSTEPHSQRKAHERQPARTVDAVHVGISRVSARNLRHCSGTKPQPDTVPLYGKTRFAGLF